MSIRAIYGYKGSGKDTLCKFINDESNAQYSSFVGDDTILDYPGIRVAFADELKVYFSSISAISLEDIESGKDTMTWKGKLIRQHLCDLRHHTNWPLRTLYSLERGEDYIVTDLRYRDDLECLRKFCAHREIDLRLIRIINDRATPFAGEGELDNEDFDLVVTV